MINKTRIRDIVLRFPLLKNLYIKWRQRHIKDLIPTKELEGTLNKANVVLLPDNIKKDITVGIVRDGIEYEGYVRERDYHPKYERFFKNNNIEHEYYDIMRSDWIDVAKKYDLIVWHTNSDPSTQNIATNKLYVLDKLMGKKCHPSFDEVWTYENKVNSHYLYIHFDLPSIPTFVTHSKKEALSFIENTKFPIISKITTGSSSFGVIKITTNKQAVRLINRAFSYKGEKTYFPYARQKDYVYFQQFIEGSSYDLRIMVVGDKLFGYYRYPQKGDFRASGAGIVEKKAIPVEALELAYNVKQKFQTTFLATDLLYSEKEQQYYIIESSIFIGVDTCEQLVVDGVAGYYQRIAEGEYKFIEGRYWVQELTLLELMKVNYF